MAVALLTIVAAGIALIAPAVFQIIASDSTTNTASDLEALKLAIAGNPRLVISQGRSDFGFIGTMGSIPTQLSKVWSKSTQPAYTFDTAKNVGAGWVGPYVRSAFVEDLLVMDKDRFGNSYTYTTTPFTRSSDGQLVAARIQSSGADGIASTADDLIEDILNAEIYSNVTGTLYTGNNDVVPYATVTLNTPVNGTVGQQTTTTDANGVYTFNNVVFGLRSLSIDPKLIYEPNSSKTIGQNRVQFTVTNYGTNNVTLTSLTATYNKTAWYEGIIVGSTTVFAWTTARAASGQTISFSQGVTVAGSGKPTQVVPIRIDKETMTAPDLFVRGVGSSVVIELKEFMDKINNVGGNAGKVNMGGTTFTINFSDGSQNTFTVP